MSSSSSGRPSTTASSRSGWKRTAKGLQPQATTSRMCRRLQPASHRLHSATYTDSCLDDRRPSCRHATSSSAAKVVSEPGHGLPCSSSMQLCDYSQAQWDAYHGRCSSCRHAAAAPNEPRRALRCRRATPPGTGSPPGAGTRRRPPRCLSRPPSNPSDAGSCRSRSSSHQRLPIPTSCFPLSCGTLVGHRRRLSGFVSSS